MPRGLFKDCDFVLIKKLRVAIDYPQFVNYFLTKDLTDDRLCASVTFRK